MSDDGFKQLLAAEERAKEIVAAVRKERQQLLKRAEDEAQADIDAYRAERQAAYDAAVQSHTGVTDERSKQLLAEATMEQAAVAANAASGKEAVIRLLLETVQAVE
eukprot:TRINITY_DN4768_c0_g2_i1.p1 TRINITY_DN4768_c0_g2~~TRINITY_DN4768_c0_g2_i1.p1  ORF type:complete len:120 (-),score=46.55 TRINITY_DN4768_c0_g2_i1:99-416(-)